MNAEAGFFRFPTTPHLAWLGGGATPREDKVLTPTEAAELLAGEVVVEEKLDGANLGWSGYEGSEPYLDRDDVRPGMLTEGSAAVAAFDAQGFGWGGRWTSPVDIQHLEIPPP